MSSTPSDRAPADSIITEIDDRAAECRRLLVTAQREREPVRATLDTIRDEFGALRDALVPELTRWVDPALRVGAAAVGAAADRLIALGEVLCRRDEAMAAFRPTVLIAAGFAIDCTPENPDPALRAWLDDPLRMLGGRLDWLRTHAERFATSPPLVAADLVRVAVRGSRDQVGGYLRRLLDGSDTRLVFASVGLLLDWFERAMWSEGTGDQPDEPAEGARWPGWRDDVAQLRPVILFGQPDPLPTGRSDRPAINWLDDPPDLAVLTERRAAPAPVLDWEALAVAYIWRHRDQVRTLGDVHRELVRLGYPGTRTMLYQLPALLRAAQSAGIYSPRQDGTGEIPRGHKDADGRIEAHDDKPE
ncbi:MAG TPA: hypothetical protein VKE74_33790 [Gemmataceae bacterium]|nr:hypothetical protein [Gemmataceae bacterium]